MSFLYTLISLLKGVTNLEWQRDFDTLAAGLGADCADGASSGGSVVNGQTARGTSFASPI